MSPSSLVSGAGGVPLHVLDTRSGARPVVLVHGWSLSHRVFAPQVEGLRDRFRVIAADLRGHGRSGAPADGCDLLAFADDLARVFDALDLHDALLAGWSWGAEIAIAALPRIRERVGALALIAPTPRFTCAEDWPHGLSEARVRALRVRLARALEATRRSFFEAMFAPGELDDARRARLAEEQLVDPPDLGAARATLDALAAADLRDRVASLRGVPLLVIHGDRDEICLPGASAWLHERVPGSERALLAGAGHAPQLSRPAEVTALLSRFAEQRS